MAQGARLSAPVAGRIGASRSRVRRFGGADWYRQSRPRPRAGTRTSVGLGCSPNCARRAREGAAPVPPAAPGGEGYKDRFATGDPGWRRCAVAAEGAAAWRVGAAASPSRSRRCRGRQLARLTRRRRLARSYAMAHEHHGDEDRRFDHRRPGARGRHARGVAQPGQPRRAGLRGMAGRRDGVRRRLPRRPRGAARLGRHARAGARQGDRPHRPPRGGQQGGARRACSRARSASPTRSRSARSRR